MGCEQCGIYEDEIKDLKNKVEELENYMKDIRKKYRDHFDSMKILENAVHKA